MMRGVVAAVLALVVCAAPGAGAQERSQETGFLNATARMGAHAMPYVVYVPRDYTPARRWPVILFLHGAGERGENGLPASQVGIGAAIRMNPERFPCLVVMPQCPPRRGWGAGIAGFTM